MELASRAIAIALAFGVTVFVHEAGHFLTARLSGMAVHEFSIGFGRPLLFWLRRGKTQYSFRFWPFFSYVRIAGMEPGDDHPQGFHKKSRPAQALVLVTGSLMNFLLAVAIFIFIGAFIGKTVAITNTVDRVLEGTPAERAGIVVGDRLIGVGGRTGLPRKEIQEAIQQHGDRPLVLEIERGRQRLSIPIVPQKEMVRELEDDKIVRKAVGRIGVVFRARRERLGIGRSVVGGFHNTLIMIHTLSSYLFQVLQREQELQVVGPVGVVQTMYDEAKVSWQAFLFTFAAVTVTIGFLNLLPLPPLDGSRLVILGLEAIRRKPFDKRKEMVVHLVGFALVLGLLVVLTYQDIKALMR